MSKNQGHPKGLYLLFVTEMWERFSYYGMRALFVLYMVKALMFSQEQASQVYGSYTGLVYLTPLLGGYIADRYWGNRRSILFGGLLMAAGQFLMFFSASLFQNQGLAQWLMFCGLGLLILGNGFFKPNISTMVGHLYEPTDHRKDAAFTIFYMGINVGATIAPLWCGFLGETGDPADFKWGFLSAGIGMLLGTTIFEVFKNKYLCTPDGRQIGLSPKEDEVTHTQKPAVENSGELELDLENPHTKRRLSLSVLGTLLLFLLFSINWSSFSDPGMMLFQGADWIGAGIFSVCIMMPIFIVTDKSLTKIERTRIYVIYIISFFVIFFWAAFEQAGASLTLFADKQTDREFFGWTMPASFLQSFNATFVVVLAPVFAALWSFLGKKGMEPASPMKQAIGLFMLSMGYLIIALGVRGVDPNVKVSILWLTTLYLLHTMGELSLSPIGLSMVNKLAPMRFASLLMGVWLMSTACANKFAGTLSGLYPNEITQSTKVGTRVAFLTQNTDSTYTTREGKLQDFQYLPTDTIANVVSEGKTYKQVVATSNKGAKTNVSEAATSTVVLKSFMGYRIANLFDFFMFFMAMSLVASVLLFFMTGKLKKMMGGIK
ncbi:MAG: peptide MFS transporter [Bacteroidaceae bacterium]|nr:peptide MFS transporter [Bacteroidaceae bacterium]